MKRQNIRRAILVVLIPFMAIIINYYSPYLIIEGTMKGIIVGSFVFFVLLFFSSLVFGRAYCGWICPFSGFQESLAYALNKKTNSFKGHVFKWIIWTGWMLAIIYIAIATGGYNKINILYNTEGIISIDSLARYLFFFFPLLVIVTILNLAIGKRAWCHYICWAGNFAAIGSKIKNYFKLPSLHLKAANENCVNCKTCNKVCSKSLDVHQMVQSGVFNNSECILCGNCVDNCPKGNVHFTYKWKK